jgi:hypothetical protein
MPISDTSIYFIIAILGLAYPISLTVITRLDEKYKSVIVMQLFRRSWEFRAFQILLIIAIGLVAVQMIWIVNWKLLPEDHPKFRYHDWAEILVSVVTGLLLIVFFIFSRRIFRFYIPLSLVGWLRRQTDNEDYLIFRALMAILFFAFENKDEDLLVTLRGHFGQLFTDQRTKAGDQPVQYPSFYYEMVYDTIYWTSKTDYWKVRNVGFAAASGRWLIGSREHCIIDELTYSWLWINLKLMLTQNREDFVEEFWHNSHQFFTTALEPVAWRHDERDFAIIINQPEIDQRERERDQFFEFHTALGAMIMYEKRYDLLKRLFNHTTSIPMRYELLPPTMNTVLALFFRFWTSDDLFFIGKYQFPGQDGIQGEFLSKEYVARYTALLFIRQYFLVSQWYGYEPVSAPDLPRTQQERSNWILHLPYFKKSVEEIQKDKPLLDALGYQAITEEWSQRHQKATPASIIDNLLERLKMAFAAEEVQQRAETEKKRAFIERSVQIINARVESYRSLLNADSVEEDFDASNLKGGYILYQKAAFAADQGVAYLNYDTFFANEIANGFTRRLTQLFRGKAVKSFLFRGPELFQAIDKLKLNPNKHVLLNFGISLDVVKQRDGIDRLTDHSYKGIPIINVQYIDRNAMRSSIIAIKKSDLPTFVFRSPEPHEIERFGLIEASAPTQLFAAVVDLNEDPQLKDLFPDETDETLDTSVILVLEFNVEVRWRKKAKLVRLSLYSDFYQEGSVNDISEVKPF